MREKIKAVENATDIAKKRAKKAEESMEQLRKKFNDSNEAKAVQELNILKHRVEDMKTQIQKDTSEKKELLSQRDEYRQAAHKLVSTSTTTRLTTV